MRALADIITISNATEKMLIGPRGAFGGGAQVKFIESEEQILLFLLAALEDPADIDQLRRACDRWLFDDSDGPRRDDHRFVRDVARACLWGGLGAMVVPEFSVRLSGPVRAARNPPKRYQEAPRIPGTLPQSHEQPFPLGRQASRQTSSPSVAHRHPAASIPKAPTRNSRMPSNASSNATSATSNAPTSGQKRPAMTWESSGVEEILAMEPPRRVEHPLPASLDDRLLYVFDQALKTEVLADEAYKQIREKLTDRIIGKVVSALVLWGAVHFTPGAVLAIAIDIVATGAALFFFGRSVVEGIQELHRAINLTRNARSWDDLDEVSLIVAHALVKLPVDTIDKIISRGGSGITSGGKQGKSSNSNMDSDSYRQVKRNNGSASADKNLHENNNTKKIKSKPEFLKKRSNNKEDGAININENIETEIAEGKLLSKYAKVPRKKGYPELSKDDFASFKGNPKPVEIEGPKKLYRIVGNESNTNGSYWSLTPPPKTEGEWRSGSAVTNKMNGDGGYVECEIPAGAKIKTWQGPIRAQQSADGINVLPGGAHQVFVSPNTLSPSEIMPTPWTKP